MGPRHRPAFSSLLLAVVFASACRADASAAPEPQGAALHAQAVALNDALESRFRAGDMPGVAALYADDAVLHGPEGYRVEGREAIDTYWARFTDPIDWRLEVITADGGRGVLYERGVSRLTYRKGGAPYTSTVQFVVLWTRQSDGVYRIAMDAYW